MNQKPVTVLITWDVDPDRWATSEHRQNALSMAIDLCEEFAVRSTFFITAGFAHEYPVHINRMHTLRQEIGCHGLTHTDEENYDRMPADLQRTYIEKATRNLETVVNSPICSFRSPRVKTSAHTLRLLSEYGYLADSSVCSQRIDLISSNLINPGWLVAPRKVYRPHHASAFRQGSLSIWEMPVSALVVPFISASLKVFGLRWMKAFFRLLYAEARITGKPIVYLAHPTEFILSNRPKTKLTINDFSPGYIRTHGLMVRNSLFRLRGREIFDATRELLAYISFFPGINFMTCAEYAGQLDNPAPAGGM